MRKVGGIYFWSVGRIGGSFYLKRRVGPRPLMTDLTLAALVGLPGGWFLASVIL
jgi:hypothetical protein